ncbi:GATA transcription factor 22-like [Dorcoceras hygrometricum]|nr:GATA transcription factor 22-like [Dorcoceras hygrometricum]
MAVVLADNKPPPSLKTIKLKNKEKIIRNKGNAPNFKKHRKMAATGAGASSSNGDITQKLDLEDFLINLSKNLAFRFRVFPQDEKDAAILLNFKKHRKMAATGAGASSSNGDITQKLDLEDFLINLSKNLAFRFRVFPQDEKDAAILLMALSSGLVHG